MTKVNHCKDCGRLFSIAKEHYCPARATLLERFLKRTISDGECIRWIGTCFSNGYGDLGFGKAFKHSLAHRVSFKLFRGDIPTGKLVLHKCDNKRCVNPDHLFIGTHKDNTRDMILKGRMKWGSAKLDKSKVDQIRQLKGKFTHRKLGEMFGVTPSNIYMILSNRTWSQYKYK